MNKFAMAMALIAVISTVGCTSLQYRREKYVAEKGASLHESEKAEILAGRVHKGTTSEQLLATQGYTNRHLTEVSGGSVWEWYGYGNTGNEDIYFVRDGVVIGQTETSQWWRAVTFWRGASTHHGHVAMPCHIVGCDVDHK